MDIEAIGDSILEESGWDQEAAKEEESSFAATTKKCSDQLATIIPCHHQKKETNPPADFPIKFSGKGSSWKNSHIECEIEKKFQTKDGKIEVGVCGSADNKKNCSAEIGAKINY